MTALSVTAQSTTQTYQRGPMEIAQVPAATRPMGNDLMIHLGADQLQDGVLEISDAAMVAGMHAHGNARR